jgi:uncharacterized protein
MENYLPLFPLNLVAFPGEQLNLHIFEERYKQLVNECVEQQSTFGIPSYIKSAIEYGTEVAVTDIVKKYPDGRMDVATVAQRVFKVMTFQNPVSGKLYAGGDVFFLENIDNPDFQLKEELYQLVNELFGLMKLSTEEFDASSINSFEIGHKVGLSIEEEYALIQITQENERQQFLLDHLRKTIPVLKEMERTKERISMNGHFKYLDPLDF